MDDFIKAVSVFVFTDRYRKEYFMEATKLTQISWLYKNQWSTVQHHTTNNGINIYNINYSL